MRSRPTRAWKSLAAAGVVLGVAAPMAAVGCSESKPETSPAFEAQPDAKLPAEVKADEEQDPRAEVYAKAMEEMADEIVAKTKTGANTDFETYEDAKAALESALPQRSLSKIDDALIDASISAEDMAGFMRDNPEFVQQVGARFSVRLAEVEPELAALIAKVATLAPPEARDEVEAQLHELGYGHLLDAPRWHMVSEVTGLVELAKRAKVERKALLVDVSAAWCQPCRDLEAKTLADADVSKLLATSFVLAKLDVTDPDPTTERLQSSLGAESLPAIVAWDHPEALADKLAERVKAGKPVPAPTLEIRVFVTPDELLPKLRRLVVPTTPG